MNQLNVKAVGIVGGGAIGRAIGNSLEPAGVDVAYWDIDSNKATVASLKELVGGSQLIVLCIPSWENRKAATQIAAAINDRRPRLVITVSKGVEPGFLTMDRVLKAAANKKFDYGLLYGPMLAAELAQNKGAYAILAVSNDNWLKAVPFFEKGTLTVGHSSDLHSIAVAGVLKNIYALAFGINDGLGLGFNTKGQLTVHIIKEMRQALTKLGASTEAIESPAGIGDLLATGWSQMSFNYAVGKALGESSSQKPKGEGVNSLKEIAKVLPLKKFPILQSLHEIVVRGRNPQLLKAAIV